MQAHESQSCAAFNRSNLSICHSDKENHFSNFKRIKRGKFYGIYILLHSESNAFPLALSARHVVSWLVKFPTLPNIFSFLASKTEYLWCFYQSPSPSICVCVWKCASACVCAHMFFTCWLIHNMHLRLCAYVYAVVHVCMFAILNVLRPLSKSVINANLSSWMAQWNVASVVLFFLSFFFTLDCYSVGNVNFSVVSQWCHYYMYMFVYKVD